MSFRTNTLLPVLLAGAAFAQPSQTFRWDKNTIPLPPDLKEIRIQFTGGEPCHSVVGVRVDSAARPSVSLTEVGHQSALAGTARASFRPLVRAGALPADRFSFAGNTVAVVCDGNRDSIVDLYISAAHPIHVALENASGPMASLAVEDGVIIRDGIAVSVKPAGMHQLILEGMSPFTVSAPGGADARFSGGAVSLVDLKNHLQSYAQPKLLLAPGTPAAGVLRLEIDDTGHVARVAGPSLTLLDEQAVETVRAWVFQPFLVAGKAAKVTGLVPFRVAAEGLVSSALEPSARVY